MCNAEPLLILYIVTSNVLLTEITRELVLVAAVLPSLRFLTRCVVTCTSDRRKLHVLVGRLQQSCDNLGSFIQCKHILV